MKLEWLPLLTLQHQNLSFLPSWELKSKFSNSSVMNLRRAPTQTPFPVSLPVLFPGVSPTLSVAFLWPGPHLPLCRRSTRPAVWRPLRGLLPPPGPAPQFPVPAHCRLPPFYCSAALRRRLPPLSHAPFFPAPLPPPNPAQLLSPSQLCSVFPALHSKCTFLPLIPSCTLLMSLLTIRKIVNPHILS